MSFLTGAYEVGQASLTIADEGKESFVKSASESGYTVNDMYMAENIVNGDIDLYTGENMIAQDDQVEESRLLGAIDLMVKQASIDPLSEADALAHVEDLGLSVDDYNEILGALPEDLIQKVANDADGVENDMTADDAVWDKIAEAHDYLTEAGLDPVESLNFAADFNEADSQEAQDKVASETEDLEQEEIDKIAEAVDYLSDIEGIHPADLMAEWDDKVAGKMEAVKKGLKTAKNVFSGAEVAGAKARKVRSLKAGAKGLDKQYKKARGMPGDNYGGKLKSRTKLREIEAAGDANIKAKELRRIKAIGGAGAAGGAAAGGAIAAS